MADSGPDRGPAADLVVVVASAALAGAVALTPAVEWTPLALVVGLPFVLLAPGYAIVSAVFPRAGETAPGETATGATARTSWLGRLGLGVGGSVVAVAAVGGALDFTVWGFQRTPLVVGLCLVTVLAATLAWVRRRRLPVEVRAGTDLAGVRTRLRTVVGGGPLEIALTVLVVVAAVGAVAVVAEDATERGTVTEFYVLGENESGALTASDYPTDLTVGEPATLAVGVGTRGQGGFEGHVVGRLERVTVADGSVTVEDSVEVVRFPVSVPAGETSVVRHPVRPTRAGDSLRLTYRLYRDGTPEPVRQVHVWVDVATSV